MWNAGTYRCTDCYLGLCHGLCQGHDRHVREIGDLLRFFQVIIEHLDDGWCRIRIQYPGEDDSVIDFLPGSTFWCDSNWLEIGIIKAEPLDDGMLFSPVNRELNGAITTFRFEESEADNEVTLEILTRFPSIGVFPRFFVLIE